MADLKMILKKLRAENNISQVELAEKLGVGSSTVAMWEVGKRFPTREKYEQLADLFNVDIDYLYGRTNIRQQIHFDNDGNAMVSSSKDSRFSTHNAQNDYAILSTPSIRNVALTLLELNNDDRLKTLEYAQFLLNKKKKDAD